MQQQKNILIQNCHFVVEICKGYSDLWKYNVTFGVLEQENEAVHVSFANEYFLKRDGTNWMGHHLHASRFRVSGILEKTKMLLIYERLNRKRKF